MIIVLEVIGVTTVTKKSGNVRLFQGPTTVFTEIFIVVLILDVTFITKFKKLNNWRCTAQHVELARLFRN